MKWLKRDKKRVDTNSITLSDVVRGIQHCVNSSIEIVEQHYMNTLQKYVNDENKIRTERINLDDSHYMDIPLICLTGHNSLEIEQMKVKMKVNIQNMALKESVPDDMTAEINEEDSYSVSRSSMLVDICNVSHDDDGTNMEIQMTFKANEPPESLSRMIETLNNNIAVKIKE